MPSKKCYCCCCSHAPFQPQQTTATHSQCGDICGRRNKNTVWQCGRGGGVASSAFLTLINRCMKFLPPAAKRVRPPFPSPMHGMLQQPAGHFRPPIWQKHATTHTHTHTQATALCRTHTHAFLINFMQFVRAEVVQGQRKSAGREGGMGNSRNALQFARVKPISAFLM